MLCLDFWFFENQLKSWNTSCQLIVYSWWFFLYWRHFSPSFDFRLCMYPLDGMIRKVLYLLLWETKTMWWRYHENVVHRMQMIISYENCLCLFVESYERNGRLLKKMATCEIVSVFLWCYEMVTKCNKLWFIMWHNIVIRRNVLIKFNQEVKQNLWWSQN